MNRIKTVIIAGLLILLLFSCSRQQPEQAADAARTDSPAVEQSAAPPAEDQRAETETAGTEISETGTAAAQPADLSSVQEPEKAPPPVPEESSVEEARGPSIPEEPRTADKTEAIPAPAAADRQETPTRIDIIREMIKAALANPPQKKPPESVPAVVEKIEPTDLTFPEMPDVNTESDQRAVIFITPDFVSVYKSEVRGAGYFSGFSDFEESRWEIAGTDRSGDIIVNQDGSFEFTADTGGFNNTLVLKVWATDSKGFSAQEIRVLVNDHTGPAITVTSPLNNTVYSMDTVISGRISGDTVDASIGTADGFNQIPLQLDNDGGFSISASELLGDVQTDKLPENIIVTVRAADSNTNESTDYLSLFRDKPEENIKLKEPADGSLFGSELSLKGEASGIAEIAWDIPGTAFSGTFQPENGSFDYPLKLSGIGNSLLIRLRGTTRDKTEAAVTARLYSSRETPEIIIREPSDGGYYRDSIPLTGRVGDDDTNVFERVKSLKWGIPGTETVDNLIFFDEKGEFTIDLSLSGKSGVLPLEISLEDYNNNIGRRILRLEDGKLPPGINLSLPSDDSTYGAFLDIAGLVTDPYDGTSYGGIAGLSYQLASTVNFDLAPVTGIINLSADNRFGVQLQTTEIQGDQQLTLSAVASNGNKTERTIELKKSSNDITSFTLSAADGSITADWRPIQIKSDYSVLVTDDGSVPSPENSRIYRNIAPPFNIGDVENGRLYSVRLVADTDLGMLSSGVKAVIPSGRSTFQLRAEGEFRQIKLEWNLLPGSDRYSIFRTDDAKKDFTLLTSGIEGNRYTDKDISYGRDYYYYVTPEGHEYAKSGYARAAMMKAPDQRVIELNKLTSFSPVNITVFGNYVYTAAGEDGFRIIDKTNPDALSVTGSLSGINVESVAVMGDYAYLACGEAGLCILNISAPQLPFLTGRKATTDALDICLKDNYAYIADGEGGIKIMDIKDTRLPERIDFIRDIKSTSVFSIGDLLFSNDSRSVHVFDTSNPVIPARIAEYQYENVVDIVVKDELAYLLSAAGGLIIIDISVIDSPVLLSRTGLTDPRALAVSEGFAYIADGRAGLKIINVNNPKAPSAFDSLKTGTAIAVDTAGENVIIASDSGLSAVQTFLQGVSFVINKLKLGLKNAGLALLRNIILVPTNDAGVEFYNIDNPAKPSRLSDTSLPVTSDFPAIGRDKLYLSEEGTRLAAYGFDSSGKISSWTPDYTLEFSDTIDFIKTGIMTENREIVSVATLGGEVYFIEDGSVISSLRAIEARDCAVQGNTAYISDKRAGLLVYDISDLTKPVLLSTVELEGADHMIAGEKTLYIITRKGIAIFDASDPVSPVGAGLIKTNYAENAELIGDNLYIAEGYKGLSVYDIRDPENPALLTVCDTVYAADLVVTGDYAFITDGTGLNTIQIFIPEWVK